MEDGSLLRKVGNADTQKNISNVPSFAQVLPGWESPRNLQLSKFVQKDRGFDPETRKVGNPEISNFSSFAGVTRKVRNTEISNFPGFQLSGSPCEKSQKPGVISQALSSVSQITVPEDENLFKFLLKQFTVRRCCTTLLPHQGYWPQWPFQYFCIFHNNFSHTRNSQFQPIYTEFY